MREKCILRQEAINKMFKGQDKGEQEKDFKSSSKALLSGQERVFGRRYYCKQGFLKMNKGI